MSDEQQLLTTSLLKGSNLNLDFSKIKADLKTYLSSQSEFEDYNFESSGLSVLLDILAYNTQMNTMTAHLALNELFLDSAQARSNVISLANQLGYCPRSVTAPSAVVNISVAPPITYRSKTVAIKEGTRFYGAGLVWYTMATHTSTRSTASSIFTFSNVQLKEGIKKTVRYYVDSRDINQKFEIPDRDVDITTVSVTVRQSESSSYYNTYTPFESFSLIDGNSRPYFIQENVAGRFEIFFLRDSNVANCPQHGNLVEIEYLYTNGASANGTSVFSYRGRITESGEALSITTVSRASGGGDKESTDSIRIAAPYYYEAQNRCVTANDYVSIIKKHVPEIESVNVWGGEKNTPADYGRVYLALKPSEGNIISTTLKNHIINDVLKPRKVMTTFPVIVDPDYTYIGLNVSSTYDKTKTSNSQQTIVDIIRSSILSYSTKTLNKFEKVFRYSKFLSYIDNCENSIQNTLANVFLVKKIYPRSSFDNEFLLKVPADFYDYDLNDNMMKTSSIIIRGRPYYIRDKINSNDAKKRDLVLVYISAKGEEIIADIDVGYIDLNNNVIYMYNFRPDIDRQEIRIYINPKSNDIIPELNQILSIDPASVFISLRPDYIVTGGVIANSQKAKPTGRNMLFFETISG